MSQPRDSSHSRQLTLLVWGIRIIALVAVGLCGYVARASTAGRLPSGCGAGSDCEQVLATRWSLWLGLPVAALGLANYVGILIAALAAGTGGSVARQRKAWSALTWLSTLAAGAGIWFVALQLGAIGHVCRYCLGIHGCGLIIAVLVALGVSKLSGRSTDEAHRTTSGSRPSRLAAWIGMGVAAVAVLIGGQLLMPSAPKLVLSIGTASGSSNPSATTSTVGIATTTTTSTAPAPISVSLPKFPIGGQEVELDPRELPGLGPADAPHVIAMMSDYTCPICRTMHGMIDKVRRRYGDQLVIIILLTPLDGACNPRIAITQPRHLHACALARIALAVWRLDRSAFERFDRWLFEPLEPRTPSEAREYAAQLVGGEASLRQAESDPAVGQTIRLGVRLYDRLNGGQIPKLLFAKDVPPGQIHDERGLFDLLEREVGVVPK